MNFTILDSEPIMWSPFVKSRDLSQGERVEFFIQEEDILYGEKIFLKIENSQICFSECSRAFDFFNRIAQTDFPDQ